MTCPLCPLWFNASTKYIFLRFLLFSFLILLRLSPGHMLPSPCLEGLRTSTKTFGWESRPGAQYYKQERYPHSYAGLCVCAIMYGHVGFVVLTAVTANTAFWVDIYERFGRTHCLHLQVWIWKQRVPLKWKWISTRLYGVTAQNTLILSLRKIWKNNMSEYVDMIIRRNGYASDSLVRHGHRVT